MAELPKFVRARLEAGQSGMNEHPDADLLTAFAENSLGERERLLVVSHLAACAICREIVSVAAPPETAVAPASVTATGSRALIFQWPVLRWAAVAAAVVVVGAAVLLKKSEPVSSPSLRSRVEVAEPTESEVKPAGEGRAVQQQPIEPRRSAEDRVADGSFRVPARVAPQQRSTVRTKADSAEGVRTLAADAATPVPTPPPPQPKASPMDRLTEMGSPHVSAASQDRLSVLHKAVPQKMKDSAPSTVENRQVGNLPLNGRTFQALTPVTPEAALATKDRQASVNGLRKDEQYFTIDGVSANVGVSGSKLIPSGAKALWNVTASGELKRSLDSGRSWEKIKVNGLSEFRVVASVGSDVWVGGQKGLLFHSSDSGVQWRKVAFSPEQAVNAAIVHINFTDGNNGTITTEVGEIWVTNDGGVSWKRK